jgi:cell division protein FtsW (lipid II flippase)
MSRQLSRVTHRRAVLIGLFALCFLLLLDLPNTSINGWRDWLKVVWVLSKVAFVSYALYRSAEDGDEIDRLKSTIQADEHIIQQLTAQGRN